MPRLPQAAVPPLPLVNRPIGEVLGREHDLGAPVTGIAWAGGRGVVTTGDGRVAFATRDFKDAEVVAVSNGAILCLAPYRNGVVVGTDDGRVVAAGGADEPTDLWRAPGGQWIDTIATTASGALAWSCARAVHVHVGDGQRHQLDHPSTVGGLAFAPKTGRLGVAHYGGATIWSFKGREPANRLLPWKGSHLDLTWSPDERFLLTATQESALHGWRLSDGADFQMNGFPAKPRAHAFSQRGEWLTNSGSREVIVWSFKGKTGPMGTSPDVLAILGATVEQVAYHPLNAFIAAGLKDGTIVLVSQKDRRELLVRRAGRGAILGLAWSPDGRSLVYGTALGCAGVVDFGAAAIAGAPGS
jgi:WD40 repeat protein